MSQVETRATTVLSLSAAVPATVSGANGAAPPQALVRPGLISDHCLGDRALTSVLLPHPVGVFS